MADRTVKVILTATAQQYISEWKKASQATKQATDTAKSQLQKQKDAMQEVGKAALVMGTVAAAGLAYVVKTTADFDAQMSQVQSLSHAGAADMGLLRDAALNAGQAIGFSASQVADAETELVKAGVSIKDIIGGGLTGALELAAAGQIDVGQATEIATIALTQFNLQGKDVPHVADLLAAGADKALGGVSDLGEALKSGGLVASQFGVSLDETVGTLSAFANAGLIGETAGTDLRQMLLKLGNPSQEAADTMKKLGVSIYDANGHFVGMSNLAGQLSTKMGALSEEQRNQALATIFGSRAIAGANVLYKEGAAGIEKWTRDVNDQGFAAEQAAGKMDNLNGDLKKLGAAFESNVIKSGGGANDVLRTLAQAATGLVKDIGGLPTPVLESGVAVLALVAGVGLLGGSFLTVVPKIAATRAALSTLRAEMPATSAAFARLGKSTALIGTGVVAAQVGFDILDGWFSKIEASSAEMTNSVKTSASVINLMKDASKGLDTKWWTDVKTDTASVKDALESAAHSSTNFFDAMSQTASQKAILDTFSQIGKGLASLANTDLPSAQREFNNLTQYYKLNATEQWRLINQMPEYKDALTTVATEQGLAATKTNLLSLAQGKQAKAAQDGASESDKTARSLMGVSDNAGDAADSVTDLNDSLENLGNANIDAAGASIQFHQAVDDATAAVQKNGATLDETTQAGRDNESALNDIAQSALGLKDAQDKAGASGETMTATVQAGRDAFIAAAVQMGLTQDAAARLADQYGLIPATKTTVVTANTTQADQALQNLRNTIDNIPRNFTITVKGGGHINIVGIPGGELTAYAGGGTVPNFGGPKSDSVIARLSAGEEVTQNPYASIYRPILKAINNGTYPRPRGYAAGGTVTPTYVSAPPQYMTAPSSAGSFPKGMVLVGTLDLGNGLEGRMKAVVADAFDADAAVHTRGFGGY